MSGDRPGLEPATTRVGGAPRAAAVAVALILGAVVWFGFMGRAPDTPRQPAPPSPTGPALARVTPAPTRAPASSPAWPPIQLGEDAFAVIVNVGSRRYLQVLHDAGPGLLRGDMRMAFSRDVEEGVLELVQLWTREDRRPFVSIASYPLPVETLVRGTTSSTGVITAVGRAQPDMSDAPRLVRRGFRMDVRLESRLDHGWLTVVVSIGGPRPPSELGDDGLIGHPGSAERGATR